jgi:hypothetical protein
MLSDLDFVTSVEQDADNRPYITPWDRTQHEGAVRFRTSATSSSKPGRATCRPVS